MELRIYQPRPQRNHENGQFNKGATPHNKGKKWDEWMDGRKRKKVLKCLHRNGNPNLAGANARAIYVEQNGLVVFFESSEDAARKLGLNARNIRHVCNGKRKSCGGLNFKYK